MEVIESQEANDVEDIDPYSHYISKSRLGSYKYCPKKFYHTYIEGDRQEETYSMIIGTRFHNFAEKFFEIAPNYPVESWMDFIHPKFSPYEQDMLRYFIQNEINRYNLIHNKTNASFVPYATEQMYYCHELKIRGVVDRIDELCPALLVRMAKDVGDTISDRTFDKILDNISQRKQLVIIEYKTGKTSIQSTYVLKSIKEEFTFYKIILSRLPEFKDVDIVCGCLINPQTKETTYVDFMRESTIEKRIIDLQDKVNRCDIADFPPDCTERKYIGCGFCKTTCEARLFNVTDEDIEREKLHGIVKDSWEYNLYI